ncbi:hypothetical protein [Paenibacillus sp.]|uniref:hypothetical protein n=1 Tax=Paenibacillus sp. TaxID=58172 RepID=UPI002D275F83|nr:hypothetical protein [Paenibacillus sp.]HZG86690.1 hypothetical protein [Paenibacillus sp.]
MEVLQVLFINILSVIIGGLIAYRIARWEHDANDSFEGRKNQVLLRENISRIREELRKNLGIVTALSGILNKSKVARTDLLDWGMTYVESISFFTFQHFSSSRLNTCLPTSLERYIFNSYNELDSLSSWYRQAAKGYDFYAGLQGSQEDEASKEYEMIKKKIDQTIHNLESNLKQIEEFKV